MQRLEFSEKVAFGTMCLLLKEFSIPFSMHGFQRLFIAATEHNMKVPPFLEKLIGEYKKMDWVKEI